MYILFLHSFINENLDSFHFLAIVNDAAINMWVHVSVGDPAFNSFGYILKSRIAGSYDNPFLKIFLGNTILFSIGNAPFYISTNSAWGFQFLCIFANTLFSRFGGFSVFVF